jgi:hypothetical protein
MATVFPFNKVSKIPSIILKQLLSLLFKQQQLILQLILEMDSFNVSISKNAKCDDAEISALKNKLGELQKNIDGLNSILNILPPVTTAFRTLSTVATVSSTVQLAIPTVPGVTYGPIGQTISAFADLIANVDACTSTLNNVIAQLNSFSSQISQSISDAEQTIADKCKTSSGIGAPGTGEVTDSVDGTQLQYNDPTSKFYQPYNVSDDDLNQRLQEIQLLIDNGFDALSNINEAPSKVLVGEGAPVNSIGQPGDYYVNTLNQIVFGPKLETNSWN